MKLLFGIYQYLIAFPILVVLTIITAILTLIGSPLFSHQWWGYYPPRIWAKCWCILMFVKVEEQYCNIKYRCICRAYRSPNAS